jgi:biotin carboxylase
MSSVQRAVIVDPYSSGGLLAQHLKERGVDTIAVQSSAEVPHLFRSSFHPEDFRRIIVHRGDVNETVAALSTEKVCSVISGCELGVELTDDLSERMGLATNGTKLKTARRNKFVMAEVVRRQGIRTAEQFSSSHYSEVIEWVRCHGRWPVIVKPVAGCASDGLHCCNSEAEVAQAYESIIGRANVLGLRNDAVLVQEYLNGNEYIVDTVSCDGRHRRASFWKYHRPVNGSSFVPYDAMELISVDGELQDKLFAYTTGVLDALEIRYGAAHCELITVDGEPVLVEVGARMNGGNNAVLSRMCGGICALDLTVQAYLDPEAFHANAEQALALPRKAANCFLIPGAPGRLTGLPKLEAVKALRSFNRMRIGARLGEPLPRVAGIVTLMHSDQTVLAEDIKTIRELQSSGFYQIEDGH